MATSEPDAPAIPAVWQGLVDDAAIFPPRDAPLLDAVTEHESHRQAAYAELVGPLVVDNVRLAGLLDVPAGSRVKPLALTVVVKDGVESIGDVVRVARTASALQLRSIEVTLTPADDPRQQVRRLDASLHRLGSAGPDEVYVELPMPVGTPAASWMAAVDEVAAAGHRLKFRTGGVTAAAFPASADLATCVEAAMLRGTAFKCTAGLHHALRHRDPAAGLERHGFLNVLVASAAQRAGADTDELARLLEERDAGLLLGVVGGPDSAELVAARDAFISFGCCDVLDPLRDLVVLGPLANLLDHLPDQPLQQR